VRVRRPLDEHLVQAAVSERRETEPVGVGRFSQSMRVMHQDKDGAARGRPECARK